MNYWGRHMKRIIFYISPIIVLLLTGIVVCKPQAVRLTNNGVEKPCIVVSGDGSQIAWIEQYEKPAPENTVYIIKAASSDGAEVKELMVLPGGNSNLKAEIPGASDKTVLQGPNYNESDLNYRVIGVFPKLRLSQDGNRLVISLVEIYQTILKNTFFVVFDLEKQTHQVLSVPIPSEMGSIVGNQITSTLDPTYWDLSTSGDEIIYVLDAVNRRGSAVLVWDLQKNESHRVLGYQKAYFDNGSLVVDTPQNQMMLYGYQLAAGENKLVIGGRNNQGQEGIWIVPFDGSTPQWAPITSPVFRPGIIGDHVFYSGNLPATWLGADGSEQVKFEQIWDIDNNGALQFWNNGPAAYAQDNKRENIVRLGGSELQQVIGMSEISIPAQWQIRLTPSSSAASYKLVSQAGNTMVLPAHDGSNFSEMDLFVVRLAPASAGVAVASDSDEIPVFESAVEQFEVGSLLKPGELNPRWLKGTTKTESRQNQSDGTSQPLPALPESFDFSALVSNPGNFDYMCPDADSENAEIVYEQARLILMQGELTQVELASVIERLEKAVTLAPDNRQYRLDLAEGYLMANTLISVGTAIEQYCLLLQKDKKDDEAISGLADGYMQLGNIEQAMELAYLRTIQNPDSKEIRHSAAMQIGTFAVETGDMAGGLTVLREIYEQHPEDDVIEGFIGLLWQLQGDAERADAIFDNIIKTNPPTEPVVILVKQIKEQIESRKAVR